MKKICIILIGSMFFLWAQAVLAVGVGVKPKEINLSMDVNQRARVKILVMNVSQEPAIYAVYPDEMPDIIRIDPSNFRLEASGTQIVKVMIEKQMPGKIETDLSVVAKPLGGRGLQAGSGVKVPVRVRVVGFPIVWVLVIVGCLAAGLVVVNIQKTKNNRQSNTNLHYIFL